MKNGSNRRPALDAVARWVCLVVILTFAWPDRLSADDTVAAADLIITNKSAANVDITIEHYDTASRQTVLGVKIPYSGAKTVNWLGRIAAHGRGVFSNALRQGRTVIRLTPLGDYEAKPVKAFEVEIKSKDGILSSYSETFRVSDNDFGIREADKPIWQPETVAADRELARRLVDQLKGMADAAETRAGQMNCGFSGHNMLSLEHDMKQLDGQIDAARKTIPAEPGLDDKIRDILKRALEAKSNANQAAGRLAELAKLAREAGDSACRVAVADDASSLDTSGELNRKAQKFSADAAKELAKVKAALASVDAAHAELKALFSAREDGKSADGQATLAEFRSRWPALDTQVEAIRNVYLANRQQSYGLQWIYNAATAALGDLERATGIDHQSVAASPNSVDRDLYTKGNADWERVDAARASVNSCSLDPVNPRSHSAIMAKKALDLRRLAGRIGNAIDDYEQELSAGRRATGVGQSAALGLFQSIIVSSGWGSGPPLKTILEDAEADANAAKEAAARSEQCVSPDKREDGETTAGDPNKDKTKDKGDRDGDGEKTKVGEDQTGPPDPDRDPEKTKSAACDQLQPAFDNAVALIGTGALGAADAELSGLDASQCPAIGPKIAAEQSRIAGLVDGLNQNADAAARACDKAAIPGLLNGIEIADHPGLSAARNKLTLVASASVVAQSAFDRAQAQYGSGDFAGAIVNLKSAKAALDGAGGGAICEAFGKRIASGISKAETMATAMDKVAAAIASCDPGKMASYSQQMKRLSNPHPLMAAKVAELDRIAPMVAGVSAAFESAKDIYARGDLGQARGALAGAQSEIAALNGNPACPALAKRIADGLDKIAKLEAALGRADAAIRSCSLDAIDSWHQKFVANPSHILIRQKIPALAQAKDRCGAAEANQSCRDEYGAAHANRNQSNYKTYVCDCDADYSMKTIDGKTQCVKANSREQEAAEASARCQSRYGDGYRAGGRKSDGGFYCIPGKATADAWCRANNQGTGWIAKQIQFDGRFDCTQTKQGAEASCAASTPGWHAGRMNSDGSYNCYPGQAARNAQCERDNSGPGWRAGPIRSQGNRWAWDCYPPRARVGQGRPTGPGPSGPGPSGPGPSGAGAGGACPPGHMRMDNGACVNLAPIFEPLIGIGKSGGGSRPAPPPPGGGKCQETMGIGGLGCYQ